MAACFFSVANILFSIFCPDLVKSYENHSEFESHGKTRMQINSALKNTVWCNKKPGVKTEYTGTLSSYFKYYKDQKKRTEDELDRESLSLFNNVNENLGKNSNAFYFVYAVLDEHNQTVIWLSFTSYLAGLLCIAIIALQNVCYVVGTMF